MRKDYLTWGLAAFVLGALLVWALPDPVDTESRANAIDDGTDSPGIDTTGEAYTADAGENAADVVGWLAMLGGLGLALAGVFKNSAAERAVDRAKSRL